MSKFSNDFNRLLSNTLNTVKQNESWSQQNSYGSKNVSESFRKSPIELNDTSPQSTLAGDPFKFSTISYPRDVTIDMQNGHYMLFYINVQNKTKYIYEPADPEGRNKTGEMVETFSGPANQYSDFKFVSYGDTDASYRAGLVKKGRTGNILGSDTVHLAKGRKALSGLASVLPTTTRITDSIAIYLPPNVSDSTTAGYTNEAALGIVGMAALGLGNIVQSLQRKDYAGMMSNIGGAAVELVKEAGINMGARALGELGELVTDVDSESIKGLANKAFGQATNPYMEVLFENVGMRSFSYNFTFAPRNSDETDDVQKIIKMFRFHMLPELRGSNSRFMTLPSTFDIHYMYQLSGNKAIENSFYTKIATCVLTDCSVDYTPDGVKSFASGAPTQIKMSLTFMETEMLTKEHVDQGY